MRHLMRGDGSIKIKLLYSRPTVAREMRHARGSEADGAAELYGRRLLRLVSSIVQQPSAAAVQAVEQLPHASDGQTAP